MKIIVVAPYFYPHIGGVEKTAYETSKRLVSYGHNVTVLTTGDKNSVKNVDGIKVYKYKADLNFLNIPISFQLFRKLIFIKGDLVHIHFPKHLIADIATLIFKLRLMPIVLTVHDMFLTTPFKKLIGFFYRESLGSLTFSQCDKITVVSKNNIPDEFFEKYKNKIKEIPAGTNIKKIKIRFNRSKKFTILFVGTMEKQKIFKGLKYLLLSMKYTKPSCELLVVGEGELKNYYSNFARNLGLKRIRFLGKVNDEKLNELFYKANCFVLPSISKQEAFGAVVLEAMSYGKPVIVTNVCGASYIVRKFNCGIVIKPKNEKDIAIAINSLLKNSNLIKIYSKNAYKTAKKFSWDKISKIYLSVYENLLKEKSVKKE
jgi:N-acetyllactosaminide 3-alpha-galactosyltransferase/rhamnosyl/mannosyltransferase